MQYIFTVYKVIELDGVRFYFSKKSYRELLEAVRLYGADPLNFYDVLTYCSTFEVF